MESSIPNEYVAEMILETMDGREAGMVQRSLDFNRLQGPAVAKKASILYHRSTNMLVQLVFTSESALHSVTIITSYNLVSLLSQAP